MDAVTGIQKIILAINVFRAEDGIEPIEFPAVRAAEAETWLPRLELAKAAMQVRERHLNTDLGAALGAYFFHAWESFYGQGHYSAKQEDRARRVLLALEILEAARTLNPSWRDGSWYPLGSMPIEQLQAIKSHLDKAAVANQLSDRLRSGKLANRLDTYFLRVLTVVGLGLPLDELDRDYPDIDRRIKMAIALLDADTESQVWRVIGRARETSAAIDRFLGAANQLVVPAEPSVITRETNPHRQALVRELWAMYQKRNPAGNFPGTDTAKTSSLEKWVERLRLAERARQAFHQFAGSISHEKLAALIREGDEFYIQENRRATTLNNYHLMAWHCFLYPGRYDRQSEAQAREFLDAHDQ